MKKLVASKVIILSTLLMLAACNSVQGLGKDLQSVGKGVQDQL